jgi:hypothetical protein
MPPISVGFIAQMHWRDRDPYIYGWTPHKQFNAVPGADVE